VIKFTSSNSKSIIMKLFCTLSLAFLFFNTIMAQQYKWASKIGGIKSDKATAIKTDDSGYVYIAGYFSNSVTLGTNNLVLNYTYNANSKEAYIAKFDSLGTCIWARSGGENFDDRVLGMDVDGEGNSIITGTFWQTNSGLSFNGNIISGASFGGGDQCFVVKHDAQGNFVWGNFVCSNQGDDQGLDVATDAAGNSYVVGFMTGSKLFCGGATVTDSNFNKGNHKHAYWVAKINKAGVFQWAHTFGRLPWDPSHNKYLERDIAVCVDNIDGVYITGGFDSTATFGLNKITTKGAYDIFVTKYDTAGNFQWATGGGSKKDDWSNGICSDNNGHIYVTGEHRDSLLIDTVIVRNYDRRDAFLLKMDAKTGKPIWGRRAGSDGGGERGNDVVADANCNIYVCGDINDSAKFGDNLMLVTGKDVQAFVARISPDGKWQWVANGGGVDSNDRGNSIAMGFKGQIYTCGHFRTPASFGSIGPFISNGNSDGFITQLHDSSFNKSNEFNLAAPNVPLLCAGDVVTINIPKHLSLYYAPVSLITTNVDTTKLILKPTTTTTFTIAIMGTGICASPDSIVFTQNIVALPVATAIVSPDIVPLIDSATLNIFNTTLGVNTYNWYYNWNLIDTGVATMFDSKLGGTFCFNLVAKNILGCADTAEACGTITTREHLFMPNAFTPNADNLNDVFGPYFYATDLAQLSNYKFAVYNQLGQEVFLSNNPAIKWNGTQYDRADCESGTYFYICRFTNGMNENRFLKGDVVLIR
jgi:gliding motility-associated-like protein